MRSEVRSRGSHPSTKVPAVDIETGKDPSPNKTGKDPSPNKDGRRPRRRDGRKNSLVAKLFGKVAKAKLRRYLLLIQRDPKRIWTVALSMIILALLACLLVALLLYLEIGRDGKGRSIAYSLSRPPGIIFNNIATTIDTQFWLPPPGIEKNETEGDWDYGNLSLDFFEEDSGTRQLYHDYDMDSASYRLPDAKRDDDLDGYYNLDDDAKRGAYIDPKKNCRRISEHRVNFQNCNLFHEQDEVELGIKFLGEGAYRQTSYKLSQRSEPEEDNFEFIRMDAMVAERLSASPRTFDIYGYCGLGILSEFFYHGDIEEVVIQGDGYAEQDLHDEAGLRPGNDLNGAEKLILALDMAEGIAVMHGYSGGIIVHDDIQLSQFLLNEDKSMLKINDFNRAEFMLFDESSQEYCKYRNGKGGGNWRAPEEYKDGPLDEKIDVWSLGNNMYGLLTGLYPLYWMDDKQMKKAVMRGETAYIDPRYKTRSPEEGRLAEIIEQCFRFSPDDRPSIFEVVTFLRRAVVECLGENVSSREILKRL
eukprot:scaffold22599_cov139-Cylindrotheca_fusiformis.AAC.34